MSLDTPSRRSPTLADVARRANVSPATASRALHGGADRVVKPELAKRVLEAAVELHYAPNAHAQALARASSTTVGVVVHDISDPYFAEMASGVFQVASEHGLLGMLCNTGRDPAQELAYISELRGQRVRAIVLAASGFEDSDFRERTQVELELFGQLGGSIAVVSRHDLPVHTVLPDNVGGARAMANSLLELGHRRIGIVTGPRKLTTVVDRLKGVRSALRKAKVPLPAAQMVECNFTRDGGYEVTAVLLEQVPDLTAIFALNDAMAVGVLAALRDLGVRVPEEVSVAGYDDIESLRDVTPSLSTVRLGMREIGARAMELALADAQEPITEVWPAEVVLRASTAPPAGS